MKLTREIGSVAKGMVMVYSHTRMALGMRVALSMIKEKGKAYMCKER